MGKHYITFTNLATLLSLTKTARMLCTHHIHSCQHKISFNSFLAFLIDQYHNMSLYGANAVKRPRRLIEMLTSTLADDR